MEFVRVGSNRTKTWADGPIRRGNRTIKDLAVQEQIDDSYLARVLRLTLFTPDIIVTILVGQ